MSKTIEEIKEEVAQEFGYKSNSVFSAHEQLLINPHGCNYKALSSGFDQVAERYAQSQTQELTEWKESMMKVHSELDLQGIGNALGLPLGSSIAPQVLPKVKELIEQNTELVEMIEHIFYKTNFQSHFPTTSIKVKNLLSKYNRLKSNTNG